MLSELGTRATIATELATCRLVRDFEQAVFAAGEATSAGLMEIAGAAVVEAIEAAWPELAPGASAAVLCGPGLNGGDGYVIARLLQERGWRVAVVGLGDPARQAPEAAAARRRLIGAGGAVQNAPGSEEAVPGGTGAASCDVLVDAILGSGARHPLPAGWLTTLRGFAENSERLVCVDGHSGLDLDTGEADADLPAASMTVTFHRARPGHVLGAGPVISGRVLVADLGLETEWSRFLGQTSLPHLWTPHRPPAAASLAKSPLHHKYDHGHALILSGGASHAGAARLAARAALRIGAGLVTLVLPEADSMVPAVPDALMHRVAAGPDDLVALLDDERITAVCIGPGLGLERARLLAAAALQHPRARSPGLSFVLDADALTAFADNPPALLDLCHNRNVVLTPHAGEFARLFPALAGRGSVIDRTQAAAHEAGCTVLHKGAATLVASPSGATRVIAAWDAPWLATAGAGDVLAGIITGLLARGFALHDAAETAAWLHAAAARRFGPGLIADDLPDLIPAVLRDLGA